MQLAAPPGHGQISPTVFWNNISLLYVLSLQGHVEVCLRLPEKGILAIVDVASAKDPLNRPHFHPPGAQYIIA